MSQHMLAGFLQMWDLEHTKEPVYTAKAHASIINQIDGTGGQASPQPSSINTNTL